MHLKSSKLCCFVCSRRPISRPQVRSVAVHFQSRVLVSFGLGGVVCICFQSSLRGILTSCGHADACVGAQQQSCVPLVCASGGCSAWRMLCSCREWFQHRVKYTVPLNHVPGCEVGRPGDLIEKLVESSKSRAGLYVRDGAFQDDRQCSYQP